MKKLLQIIYISRSTFESPEVINKIEPNVARILSKSRVNNRKNGLVGVLYFGDGVFFQCLEGEEEAINTLLTKLDADPRHRDLKIISKKYVDEFSFGEWSMKFAPLDQKIAVFLKENGFKTFDPYLFSGEIINKFLNLLFDANDPTEEKKPVSSNLSVESPAQKTAINLVQMKSNISLILSLIALGISLISFLSTRNYL
jgi:hypothetical protein